MCATEWWILEAKNERETNKKNAICNAEAEALEAKLTEDYNGGMLLEVIVTCSCY